MGKSWPSWKLCSKQIEICGDDAMRLDAVIKSLSVANAAIKNTASPVQKDGWYPTFSASGQDVWLPEYRFDQRGIVVSAVGARCGKAFKADGRWNVCANTHALSVDESIADRDYCWYMLNNENWWIKGGTAQPFVKVKDSLKRDHSFPTLSVQKRIVRQLDQVNHVIALRQQELSALDTLIKARFVEMFGKTEYPQMTLYDVIMPGAGLSYGIIVPGDYYKDGCPMIRPSDYQNGKLDLRSVYRVNPEIEAKYSKTRLQGNEILVQVIGQPGQIIPATEECKGMNVTRNLAVIRPNSRIINRIYLVEYMRTDQAQKYMTGSTKQSTLKQLPLSLLKFLVIPIPPIEKQLEFAAFVSQVDKSKVAVQKALDEAQLLFDSLMQQYFG